MISMISKQAAAIEGAAQAPGECLQSSCHHTLSHGTEPRGSAGEGSAEEAESATRENQPRAQGSCRCLCKTLKPGAQATKVSVCCC